MTNEELIREFLSKWRHHKRRMYAHEILTEDDLLPDDMWLEKHLTVITTAHQKELQKARQDWLRSEIEKLEGKRIPEFVAVSEADALNIEGFNKALTSIITRYKEELSSSQE